MAGAVRNAGVRRFSMRLLGVFALAAGLLAYIFPAGTVDGLLLYKDEQLHNCADSGHAEASTVCVFYVHEGHTLEVTGRHHVDYLSTPEGRRVGSTWRPEGLVNLYRGPDNMYQITFLEEGNWQVVSDLTPSYEGTVI
jgi:hypothetical protein